MAGFIEEILSGRYPRIESLWRTEFGKVVDELLVQSDQKESDDPPVEQVALQADIDRLETLLANEKARHEATKRELDVAKRERASLRYQIDAINHALKNIPPALTHKEPI